MTKQIVVVVGNPKAGSRTRTVAESVAHDVSTLLASESAVTVVELAEHAGELFDWGSATVNQAVQTVLAADLLIVASPVYKASYTGLLKAFLDRIGGGALHGTWAVPLMVGGAPGHALAVEVHLRPLLVELGATCTTPGLFVLESTIDELDEVLKPWIAATGDLLAAALDRVG